MTKTTSREWHLKARPEGMPSPENFELVEIRLDAPGPGELLVRNRWMSVDPYMRGRMTDRPSYIPPFRLGFPLEGGAIGEVIASNDPAFKPGDRVTSMMGWREAFITSGAAVQKIDIPAGIPEQAYLGVLGMPGLTAYAGLLEIGKPAEGQTVFVSAAAGAVGSIVCQIAKQKGCKVIASAGSDEKCGWLRSLGVDIAINYKSSGNLLDTVRQAAPDGIDIYFDNVGGEHLEVAIEVARPYARFVECGMIGGYNDTAKVPGPRNLIQIVGKRLTLRGFIVSDFSKLRPQFLAEMEPWIAQGKVRWQATVTKGIENAPDAFMQLFAGGNIGKMLVMID